MGAWTSSIREKLDAKIGSRMLTSTALNHVFSMQQRVDKIFRMMDRDKNAQRKCNSTLCNVKEEHPADILASHIYTAHSTALTHHPASMTPGLVVAQSHLRSSRREASRTLRLSRPCLSTMASYKQRPNSLTLRLHSSLSPCTADSFCKYRPLFNPRKSTIKHSIHLIL